MAVSKHKQLFRIKQEQKLSKFFMSERYSVSFNPNTVKIT